MKKEAVTSDKLLNEIKGFSERLKYLQTELNAKTTAAKGLEASLREKEKNEALALAAEESRRRVEELYRTGETNTVQFGGDISDVDDVSLAKEQPDKTDVVEKKDVKEPLSTPMDVAKAFEKDVPTDKNQPEETKEPEKIYSASSELKDTAPEVDAMQDDTSLSIEKRRDTKNDKRRLDGAKSGERAVQIDNNNPRLAGKEKDSRRKENERDGGKGGHDKKNAGKSRKAAARDGATWQSDEDTQINIKKRSGNKKSKAEQQIQKKPEPVRIERAVITTEKITVKELAEKIGKPVSEIIMKLMKMGNFATINQEIDFDTCALVAADYDIELEYKPPKTFEDILAETLDDNDPEELLVPRAPVVTIMGHVDHGKTSLLDAIRNSRVTAGEAGGITQHIGAYQVKCNGRDITFIDTPGHEAFTSMRARGAQVTDIVILVVAADDGIMPQTIEAINHAQAAGVPIIVAINKIDKDTADPDAIISQLTAYNLVPEDWGGDTIVVKVSAKKHLNIDELLEMILLQADVLELRANPGRLAKGVIIEAQVHKGRGPIATVLVQNGTLRVGDCIVAGTAFGNVRALIDDKGRRVDSAGPGQPVEVLGLDEVPSAGDSLVAAKDEKLVRRVADARREKQRAEQRASTRISLDDLFSQISEGQVKELNLIVKADVHGSVEAVKQALSKLSNNEVKVCCIHGGVGAITTTDVNFAAASNAIIIGFNVRPDAAARALAEKEKVDIKLYRIIYDAINEIEAAMRGLSEPTFREVELGKAEVRDTFRVSGVGTIAGCYVQEGKILRNAKVRIVRDGIVIHEGKMASLRRFKDDVKEVASGYECGIGIENYNDIKLGDSIEAFIIEEVEKD